MARKRPAYGKRSHLTPVSVANFSLTYKTDPCGGTVQGPHAVITSPGFPGAYPPNMDCAWIVEFQPDSNIHVKFESLDLDADCGNSFVRLYNGGTQTHPHLTPPLCGNNLPAQLMTQHNTMFMEFHSGPSNPSHKGFKIRLSQDLTGCGGTYHLAEGEIQSPNYGTGDYPNNTECDWTVILPAGTHGSLSFLGRFSLETSDSCSNDFIQIFDWRNEKWEQIGSNLCGRTVPSNINTTTNQFRVLFRTNPSVTSDGFQLSWTHKCGGVINVVGSGGSIISPNYPKQYYDDLLCSYTLLTSGQTIYGTFKDFSVQEELSSEGNRCRYDNVTLTIYSSRFIPHYLRRLHSWINPSILLTNRNEVFCGSQIPEPVYSFNKLELVFSTDSYLTQKGFLFTYSVARCGGNITSPTSISQPNNTHFQSCVWFVTAPPDKVVVMKIQNMQGFFYSCDSNKIQLYNGHNLTNSSSLIDTICSSPRDRKSRYVSQSNQMAISYYSDAMTQMRFQAAIGFTYGEKHNCGGTIRTANTSLPYLLQAPDVNGDGKYEPFLSCDWLFLAPDGQQIRASFNKLDIQNCSSCGCDVLKIIDGDTETENVASTSFCTTSTSMPPDFVSSMGSLLIHFSSDIVENLSGFQLTITTFATPCGPTVRHAGRQVQELQSPSLVGSVRCLWTIMVPPRGSGLLRLHFTHLNLSLPCSNNYLEITDKIAGLYSGIRPGFGGLVPRYGAPSFLRSMQGLTMDPGYIQHPFRSPFTRFVPSFGNNRRKLCGTQKTDFTIINRNVQLQYVTNRESPLHGFKLEYNMKECDENYTAPFGRIVANRYFQNFEDSSCHIVIRAPYQNSTVSLFFNSFFCSDRSNQQGRESRMVVYDGTNDQARELATFCSAYRPDPIFSTGPALYLRFQSLINSGSFDITYTTTDKGRGCGGEFQDFSGKFTSPLYPSPYKQDSSCRWDVSVPHGNKLVFNFINVNLGQALTCSTNYVQFFDVDRTTGLESLHSRYCGNDKPSEIQMNGETGFVRYVTSIHNNGTGWVLSWSAQAV